MNKKIHATLTLIRCIANSDNKLWKMLFKNITSLNFATFHDNKFDLSNFQEMLKIIIQIIIMNINVWKVNNEM